MDASGDGIKSGSILTICTIVLIIVVSVITLNRISLETAHARLQAMADTLALATLLSPLSNDDEALRQAGIAAGLDLGTLSPSLRRYRSSGANASEVVLAATYAPPFALPGREHGVQLEVTGKAITWR